MTFLLKETFPVLVVSASYNVYRYEAVYKNKDFVSTSLVSCKMRLFQNFIGLLF